MLMQKLISSTRCQTHATGVTNKTTKLPSSLNITCELEKIRARSVCVGQFARIHSHSWKKVAAKSTVLGQVGDCIH
uniref:Uncharacterized protein n=1 Tax=Anguilla anguilla TaxID=7936 RepID=A0A0E9WQJ5_ANGAN